MGMLIILCSQIIQKCEWEVGIFICNLIKNFLCRVSLSSTLDSARFYQFFVCFSFKARQRAFFLLDTFLFLLHRVAFLKESLKCNKSSFFMWWHLAGKICEYLLRVFFYSDTQKEISGKHFLGVNEPKSRYPDSAQGIRLASRMTKIVSN